MLRRFAIPAAVAGLLLVAACGDANDTVAVTVTTVAGAPSTTAGTIVPDVSLIPPSTIAETTVPHPKVSVPAAIPTKLVTTVITPGTGTASKTGDAVVVNYVGARSEDGTEFDNNYGKAPLTVFPLGKAQTIQGFNDGLTGVQAGEQLQLDIPNDLAYGDSPQGDVIKAGDALSFHIDVLAVFPATTKADEPVTTVVGAPNRDDLVTNDIVVGTGVPVTEGLPIAIEIVAYRADTGERVFSTWDGSAPVAFRYKTDSLLEGLVAGLDGMHVGGRREMTIPFTQAFGEAGNADLGLPASTDVVLVVDVVATF